MHENSRRRCSPHGNTKVTTLKNTAAKPLGFWCKFFILLLASILGAITMLVYEGAKLPDSSDAWAIVAGRITGASLVYFLIAIFFAGWVKGIPGIILGTAIVALQCYWGSADANRRHKGAGELIASMETHLQAMNDSARSQLKSSGHMDIDPAKIQSVLDDMSEKSKDLDPETKSAVEAMAAVMSALMVPLKEAHPIGEEILTAAFQDPSGLKTGVDIDSRLVRVRAFRALAQQLLSMYPDLDVMLKTELARRNVPPLRIKECTDSFIKAAHLEIAIPMAQSNVDYADLLIGQFTLLKGQIGEWYTKGHVVYFEDPRALRQWNDGIRQLFKVAEDRETLERRFVAAQQPN
jgi:hypothetical protein